VVTLLVSFVRHIPSKTLLASAEIPTDKVSVRGLKCTDQACLLYEIDQGETPTRSRLEDKHVPQLVMHVGLNAAFALLSYFRPRKCSEPTSSLLVTNLIYQQALILGNSLLAAIDASQNEVNADVLHMEKPISLLEELSCVMATVNPV
jgi:hypothetical protein